MTALLAQVALCLVWAPALAAGQPGQKRTSRENEPTRDSRPSISVELQVLPCDEQTEQSDVRRRSCSRSAALSTRTGAQRINVRLMSIDPHRPDSDAGSSSAMASNSPGVRAIFAGGAESISPPVAIRVPSLCAGHPAAQPTGPPTR